MANYCADCAVHMKVYDGVICCGYLLKTGHRRPSEPGEGCTAKVKFRRRSYPKRKGSVDKCSTQSN